MPDVTANGISIHYEDEGEGQGPPVVLVTGLSYGLWSWHWVAPVLARSHRVIRMDNRGVDGSDKPPGPYTTGQMAEDVLGLLDALDLPPCALVGMSLGGFIAQEVALARPERVERLVLMATSYGGPNSIPPTPAALEVMMNREGGPLAIAERALKVNAAPDFPQRHPERLQEYFRYRERPATTPDSYMAQLAAGMTHDTEARVSALTMPVLILHGDQDQVVPTPNAQLLANKLPHARVRLLQGAGHFLPMEKPDEVAEAISYFLASAASFSR